MTFSRPIMLSLFTNTPIPKTMEIIKNILQKDTTLAYRTRVEIEDIMALLEFVLNTTYFTFRNMIFQQEFNTALGSPMSLTSSWNT